jgi:hypothetical protein
MLSRDELQPTNDEAASSYNAGCMKTTAAPNRETHRLETRRPDGKHRANERLLTDA